MPPTASPDLDRRIDAFEDALRRDPAADLAAFLPPAADPDFAATLGELIRVDLDNAWTRGRPARLADYRRRFPAAFADPAVLGGIAFEEYRQRRLAGEAVAPGEYRTEYGIDPAGWPAVGPEPGGVSVSALSFGLPEPGTEVAADIEQVPPPPDGSGNWGPDTAVRSAAAVPDWLGGGSFADEADDAPPLPEPGGEFLGFRLDAELGRGAFGRVFLARQDDLAGRPVALKVGYDIVGESRTLAQLQHTNIVPIYSYHRAGQVQAVCMPYFGRTTLADVLRQIDGRPPSSGKELRSTVNRRSTSADPRGKPIPLPAAPPPPQAEPAAAPDGWARLDGLSYVEAVLWLAARLADGLQHAHDRGILHRDLKPANVLLTDAGVPMLLDFNLAEDTKLRGTAEGAAVGGTLPYMAPEQLEAFRHARGPLDGRCDVYALGVLLFELLAGRHPFPVRRGPARDAVPQMIDDRRGPPPSVRQWNPAVPAAVEAVVRKCLAPDPADRYPIAEYLREDLERQLAHRPLRYAPEPWGRERLGKWARRHPRVTSSLSVGAAAGVLIGLVAGGAAYAVDQARDDRARSVFADHRAAFADARVFLDDRNQSRPHLGAALAKLRGVLARYGVPEDGGGDGWLHALPVRHLPAADRDRLREDVGETFYLMAQVSYLQARTADAPAGRDEHLRLAGAWNTAAGRFAADRLPRALRQQRADLAALAGDAALAARLAAEAEATPPASARDEVLLGTLFAQTKQLQKAVGHLTAATRRDPEGLSGWFVRGTAHLDRDQPELAAECFAACVALRPDFAPAWLNRGLAYSRMRFGPLARADFDRAVELDPTLAEAFVQRAFLKGSLGDPAGAAADLGKALETGAAPPRVHFLRASFRRQLNDAAGAGIDVRDAFRLPCADELSWVARSEVRLQVTDAHAAVGGFAAVPASTGRALADVNAALAINPESMYGLQMKAHVLAEHLGRAGEALAVLDRLVELYPESAPARAGRGVVLARAGKRAAAVRDAEAALLLDTKAPNLYQVGCVYALTSRQNPDDKREAFRLLWAGLKTGFGLDIVETDSDLDPVRTDPAFRALVAKARRLRAELDR